jgi:hypothetical protein
VPTGSWRFIGLPARQPHRENRALTRLARHRYAPVEIIDKLNNEINAVLADAKAKYRGLQTWE